MKILHRVCFVKVETPASVLEALGVGEDPRGLIIMTIVEGSALWDAYVAVRDTFRPLDMASTEFSAPELRAAPVLELVTAGPVGYPQPSDDFGYRKITYDPAEHCETCGLGLTQVKPFMLARAPLIRGRSAFQLHWVDDAFFVREEAWRTVFEPFGIASLPVLYSRARTAVEGIVQLVVDERVTLSTQGLAGRLCELCGRWKYEPVRRGASPAPAGWGGHMAQSDISFGHGAAAFRATFVSNVLYAAIERHGVRGFVFHVAGAVAPPLA